MYGLREKKNELRLIYKEKRKAVSAEERQRRDSEICKRFISLCSYRFADIILMYSPLKSEIDVTEICIDALSKGKKVAFPRCLEKGNMVYHYVTSLSLLESGSYGIMEPPSDLPVYDKNIGGNAVCLIPALAYDSQGYRLGYGKGYYDRFLSDFKGVRAGIIYSDFISDSLPHGKYDLRSDLLVTDKGVIPVAKN